MTRLILILAGTLRRVDTARLHNLCSVSYTNRKGRILNNETQKLPLVHEGSESHFETAKVNIGHLLFHRRPRRRPG